MPPDFVQRTVDAFSKIKEEIDEKGGELDFRHSFGPYFLRDVLRWTRKRGEGHYVIHEPEDISLYDDSGSCVAIIETKSPAVKLKKAHREELKRHLDDVKTARYGALTNAHVFQLFEYNSESGLSELASIDISSAVRQGAESLSKSERQDIYLLRRLMRDRFVGVKPEYFTKTAQKVPVEKKFVLFIENLRESLDDLTRIIDRFFRFYQEAGPEHYGGKFLREEAFPKWKGASTGKEEELREKFCKETAYVFLNRILFTRILEDKEIVPRLISGKGLADSLRLYGEGAYEGALRQAYKNVEMFYEHFYEFGIFDWWRLPEHEREMSVEDEEVQEELESELHSVVVRNILKRLNQFNFREVGRDILGDVYQEYLPPAERKRLGEFYTPIEVVRYILDAVGCTPEEKLEEKLLLDPACGSGTFLVEATSRLIERHDKKGARLRDPDDCKRVLGNIINNIHGLDINPFACHIAEMNLLFTVIDLLNAVQRKYKSYKLGRFNICQTDSLLPLGKEPVTIGEFVNGRIRSWTEETKRANQVKKKQFDFVVGNPPYVRTHYMEEIKPHLKEIYPDIAVGQFDLFIVFIKRGASMLREEGSLGFIVSNKLLANDYGQPLREFMLRDCLTKQIIDASEVEDYFTGAVYPIIITLSRPSKPYDAKLLLDNRTEFTRVTREGQLDQHRNGERLLEFHKIPQKTFLDFEKTVIPSALTEENISIVKKLEKIPKLRDNWEVDRAKPTSKKIIAKKQMEELPPNVRSKYVRAFSNKDVQKYRAQWDGDSFINRVEIQPDISKSKKRILMRKLCLEITAAYDDNSLGCINTIYTILPSSKTAQTLLEYCVGILNSKLIDFYSKVMFFSTHMGSKYIELRTTQIEQLPIKIPQTSHERNVVDQITEKVNCVLQAKEHLTTLEEKIENFPETYVPKTTKKLSEAAENYKNLTKDKYKVRSPKTEKSGKGLYKLYLDKDNYITFAPRELAEYVLEWLKRRKRVRRRELLGLEVPSEKEVVRVMKEFSGDRERVEELKGEVKGLEDDIDGLVYELYGLDAKDRKVIEEFLRRF